MINLRQDYYTLRAIRGLIVLFVALLLPLSVIAGELVIKVTSSVKSKPLLLDSLRYEQQKETYSVSRLSMLLCDVELQKEDGSWVAVKAGDENAHFFDAVKRRTTTRLTGVPEGKYRAIRFAIGPDKVANHSDPARYHAKHPLNPNLNQLHWDWKTGYIFLALEGKYRVKGKELNGYVFHFANNHNRTVVTLSMDLALKTNALLELDFDIASLLSVPYSLTFSKGNSTHSHAGDPIAKALQSNLPSAFQVKAVRTAKQAKPQLPVKPLYLPNHPKGYPFKMSARFPIPDLPRDNPLLISRVELGKKLFHDTRLSANHRISCATCHHRDKAFTDGIPLSIGINSEVNKRNSMPLFNLAWKKKFFWDGRANSLREQVLMPIKDHKEMAQNLPELVKKLKATKDYPPLFERAFKPAEITEEKIALALEAFLLSITSYDSKFDRAMKGEVELDAEEKRGFELFITEYEPRTGQRGADCFHCHGGALFSDHQFHNNGLPPLVSKRKEIDVGLFGITKKPADKGKFATPSLRNVALTAPYMHDGRFKTLKEVVIHYNSGVHRSETLDPNLAKHPVKGIRLSEEDVDALVAFLQTLTDEKYKDKK